MSKLLEEVKPLVTEVIQGIDDLIQIRGVHVVPAKLKDGTDVLVMCSMIGTDDDVVVTAENKEAYYGAKVNVYPLCILGPMGIDTGDLLATPEGMTDDAEKRTTN